MTPLLLLLPLLLFLNNYYSALQARGQANPSIGFTLVGGLRVGVILAHKELRLTYHLDGLNGLSSG